VSEQLLQAIEALISAMIEEARPKEYWECRPISEDPVRDARDALLAEIKDALGEP
jgi:hypothetical protein